MFLTACAVMARASCITTFCPDVEDIKLPESEAMWDADGWPKFIEIEWTCVAL